MAWRPIDCRRFVEAQSLVPGTMEVRSDGVGCRFAFEEKAELKGVANQLYVRVDHVHAALRYGDDKSVTC